MGGQMWQLLEAEAEVLGEGSEFRRVRGIVEGLVKAVGDEVDAERVMDRLKEVMTPLGANEGLLTRRDLMQRWQVSKHVIKHYEQMGMPVTMKVGTRPRYDLKEVERWREEALGKERGSKDGTGGFAHGTPREESERRVSSGRRLTGRPSPLGQRPKPDLLSSYGSSTKGRPLPS